MATTYVSRGIRSGLNSGVTGFCFDSKFDSKLRKCSEDLVFWSPRRKIGGLHKICVAVSLETLREDPTVRVRDKQAVWNLLSEISRTAPGEKMMYELKLPKFRAIFSFPF